MYFGLIRSCDHDEVDVHMRVQVKMATGLKILVFASFFLKYHWNIMYLFQLECFKIKIVDLYTQTAGDKAVGEQIFKVFEDLFNGCQNTGPG